MRKRSAHWEKKLAKTQKALDASLGGVDDK